MSSMPIARTGLLTAVATVGLAAALVGCGKGRPGDTNGVSAAADHVAPAATSAKRSPPIVLEFVAENPADADAPARILLAATASVDLPDCVMTVSLSEGATLAEGSLTWRGALVRGRRQTHAFAVRVPDGRRGEITAAARAEHDGGTVVAREATLVLDPGAAPAKPAVPPGTLKTNSRGEPIRELPGGDLK